VLAIVHNITSATRMLDLLSVFDGDRRVQTVFTVTESSLLDGGTAEFLDQRGMLRIPWEAATTGEFDLAITASRGGELHRINAPIIFSSHGAGYNKYLSRKPEAGSRKPEAGSRKPEAGSRKPEAGSRKPEAGSRKPEAFGLDSRWLMHEGRVVPSALVLSHEEQLRRLERSCPEAVPMSVVAGDATFDRLHASVAFREDYRGALGLQDGQRLVVVSTTWGRGSLMGQESEGAGALRAALAELPREEFRVLATIHPNAWFGHGAWQMLSWLAPLAEQGLLLPAPETETWKAALLAADYLIGDHGSLTMYGLALHLPVLLGAFDTTNVADRSPMAAAGRELRRYDPRASLLAQLEKAAAEQAESAPVTRLRSLVTSRPGQAAALLRQLFYQHLDLPEPELPTAPRPIALPVRPDSTRLVPLRPAVYAAATASGPHVVVRRFPASLQRDSAQRHLVGTHLVVDIDDPDPGWLGAAGVLVVPPGRPLHAGGEEAWQRTLQAHPGALVLALARPGDSALLLVADGLRLRAVWQEPRPWWASTEIAASVVHDLVACGAWNTHAAAVPWEVRTGSASSAGFLRLTVTS
jgi:hypothetical protein